MGDNARRGSGEIHLAHSLLRHALGDQQSGELLKSAMVSRSSGGLAEEWAEQTTLFEDGVDVVVDEDMCDDDETDSADQWHKLKEQHTARQSRHKLRWRKSHFCARWSLRQLLRMHRRYSEGFANVRLSSE